MKFRRKYFDEGDAGGTAEGGGTADAGGENEGGQGTGDQPVPWYAALPDDLKNNESIRQFADVGALAKSFAATKASLTRTQQDLAKRPAGNAIVVPGEGATEKQWAEYRKAVGIPENKDGYKFPDARPGDPAHPERGAISIDDSLRAQLAERAFERNMTQEHFDVATGFLLETIEKATVLNEDSVRADHERSQRALQERFGAELPKLQAEFGRLGDAFGQAIGDQPWYPDFLARKVFPNGLGNDGDFQTFGLNILAAMRLERVGPPSNGNNGGRTRPANQQRQPAGRRTLDYADMDANGMVIQPTAGGLR